MNINLAHVHDEHIRELILKEGYNGRSFNAVCEEAPLQLIHYLRKWENLDEEEFAAYKRRCNIDALSEFVWDSTNITNCHVVADCTSISNSSFVWRSNLITDSENIYECTDVNESKDVYHSEGVHDSEKILKSKNISHSKSVLCSNGTQWSENISYSYDLDNCQYVYKSNNSYNCFFSGFLRNCSNCICCTNLVNCDFYIFNQPVSAVVFERVKEELLNRLVDEESSFITVNEQIHREDRVKYDFRLDNIFDGLSDDFYGYIGTLPNYDEGNFLSIFFRR